MKKMGIKDVVAIGIGTALFVALTQVQIPLGIPNTYLQPRVALLAFLSAVFGPLVGGAVGLIGHALGDALFYGGSIWWSWVIPEGVFGVVVGLFAAKYAIKEGNFGKKAIITFNVVQIIANVVAWIVVAPALDVLIYAEPYNKVIAQGVGACIGNVLVAGILGTLLAVGYSKMGSKSSSLNKED